MADSCSPPLSDGGDPATILRYRQISRGELKGSLRLFRRLKPLVSDRIIQAVCNAGSAAQSRYNARWTHVREVVFQMCLKACTFLQGEKVAWPAGPFTGLWVLPMGLDSPSPSQMLWDLALRTHRVVNSDPPSSVSWTLLPPGQLHHLNYSQKYVYWGSAGPGS